METLQVTDLHYTYPATEGEAVTDIFQGLDLTIPHGSFVAILGHNGCGKSTLAKHFNAILLPSGGKRPGLRDGHRETKRCCWRSGAASGWFSRTRITRS